MKNFFEKSVSVLAVTVMIGGLSLAHPAFAVDDTAGTDEAQSGAMVHKGGIHRVDERIRELHDKLGVTTAQDKKWKTVANVIRQNEVTIHRLVETRNNKENMNAVEDLKSYEKIAAAHEQGLKKLIPAFERFYNSLTPDQKSTADDMFSNYEGRGEDRTGNAERFHNIQPASGESNTNANGVNNSSNTPANDTGTTANPSDQPANQGGSQ